MSLHGRALTVPERRIADNRHQSEPESRAQTERDDQGPHWRQRLTQDHDPKPKLSGVRQLARKRSGRCLRLKSDRIALTRSPVVRPAFPIPRGSASVPRQMAARQTSVHPKSERPRQRTPSERPFRKCLPIKTYPRNMTSTSATSRSGSSFLSRSPSNKRTTQRQRTWRQQKRNRRIREAAVYEPIQKSRTKRAAPKKQAATPARIVVAPDTHARRPPYRALRNEEARGTQ